MASRTLLIDADIFIYQAATNAEIALEWAEDEWTLHAHAGPAKEWIRDKFERLADELKAEAWVAAVSDPGSFRKELVDPTYKSNRKKKRQPMIRKALRDFVMDELNGFMRLGLEGDDVLGILATAKTLYPGEKIIVSTDKDMKTIPGKLYNDGKGTRTVVSPWEADLWFLMQTLMGDTTDGYPGCPGFGPKTAEKLLAGVNTLAAGWSAVVKAYEKAGKTKADALTQARLARILRASDYDFKKKEVILWNAPA